MSVEFEQSFKYNAAKIVPRYVVVACVCFASFIPGLPTTYLGALREPPGIYVIYACGLVLFVGLIRYLPEFIMSLTAHRFLRVDRNSIHVSHLRERRYDFEGDDPVSVEIGRDESELTLVSTVAGRVKIPLNMIYDGPLLLRMIRERTLDVRTKY